MLTNWIMSCVNTTSFAILINGGPTPFFQSGRGLRQGCPLSPLLFILVMEGLSLLLKKAQLDGKISGVKISRLHKILNLFFVDDVLIMTGACLDEWKEIKSIFFTFCRASGLIINPLKSSFHFSGLQEDDLTSFKALFPYKFVDLIEGFRIWDFFLSLLITGLRTGDGSSTSLRERLVSGATVGCP
jgi:hypothetical protein